MKERIWTQAVSTDSIHSCGYKNLAIPEGWETITVYLPFPTLSFILLYRPEMISFPRSSILLFPKNNNDRCEAQTPHFPLTFPETSQRSGKSLLQQFLEATGMLYPEQFQHESHRVWKLFSSSLFIQLGKLWQLCLLLLLSYNWPPTVYAEVPV